MLLRTPVWFVLIEAEVIGDTKQPWIRGSRVLLQTFTPTRRLEDALTLLDEFLPSQELKRLAEYSDTNQRDRLASRMR